MATTVRSATLTDLDFVEKWGRALFEVERGFEPHMLYAGEHFRKKDGQQLANPKALYLIAEVEHRPVGYLAAFIELLPNYLALSGLEGVIEVVYIEEPVRGTGVADQLVEACLSWLQEAGAKRVRAGVYAQNRASLNLFQRFGLHPHHIMVLKALD